MLCAIHKNGLIKSNDLSYEPNIFDLRGDSVLLSDLTKTEIGSGKYTFDSPLIKTTNDYLEYIALPGNYRGNIFFSEYNELLLFSDDFFALCKYIGCIHINQKSIQSFITTSGLPTGETWAKEISILASHRVYYLLDGKLVFNSIGFEQDTIKNEKSDLYSAFKESLDFSINHSIKNKNALLLSGGADSRLLALLMKKNNINFETYTIRSYPFSYSALEDVELAARISELIGVKNNVVDLDYREIDLSMLDEIIAKMPLSCHLSFPFLFLMKKISEDNCDAVWCGQNADNLYNLGASGRMSLSMNGFMNLFKRFCLTEEFFSILNDSKIKVNPVSKLFRKCIAKIGEEAYSKMKHKKVRLPQSSSELVYNFKNSYDYTIFSSENTEQEHASERILPCEVKNILYKHKVENYLKSGASQVIDSASMIHKVDGFVLPYSSEKMLNFFYKIRLNYQNIFFPKQYIYRYIKEFKGIYGKEIVNYKININKIKSRYVDVMGIHESYDYIMEKTNFGEQLRQRTLQEKPEGYTGVQYLQTCLNMYWKDRVVEMLIMQGVTIQKGA